MKNLLLLFFTSIIFNTIGKAQEVLFDSKIQPSTEYITEVETTSTFEFNFKGPEEKMVNIEASGIELPILAERSTFMTSTLRTLDLNPDSTFKAKISYDHVKNIQIQNGKRIKNENPISGLLIEGTYNAQNKFKIDTIISDKIDQNTRNALKYTLENIQEKISFPEYPLKVGNSFKQEIPMTIPVAGINNVEIIVNTNYLLTDIQGDIALFDIAQSINLNMEMDQANVSASGTGTGTSEYSISKKFITKYNTDLTIELNINIEDMEVLADVQFQSAQNVTIK